MSGHAPITPVRTLVTIFLTLLVFTMLVVRGSSSNYFFQYYLDQAEIYLELNLGEDFDRLRALIRTELSEAHHPSQT